MDLLQAGILAIIEGLTEFLPISSTGHMVLVSHLMGIGTVEFVKSFEIVIQVGAIAAVGWEYGKRFLNQKDLLKRVFLTFTPTGLLGFALYGVVKKYLLGSALVTVLALIIGGILIVLIEEFILKNKNRDKDNYTVADLSWQKCVVLGCAQAVAIIPGVSRAAMTIMTGMMLGLSRKEATEFSFLVAAPTLLAASGLDIVKNGMSFTAEQWMVLAFGFGIAFLTALVTVRWLVRYLEKHTFKPFGFYRIGLGIIYALLFLR